jgi:hypothetical protein
VKLKEELNKYSKDAIIEAIVNSSMFMLRDENFLDTVISKEIDLLFKKQEELLNTKYDIKENIPAKEVLKVLEQRELKHKKYTNLSKQINKLEEKLYGKYL